MCGFSHQLTQCKSSSLKTGLYVETHLLILKHLLEGQGYHTSKCFGCALRECTQGYTVLVHSLGLATAQWYLPEGGLDTQLEPKFCIRRDTSRSPALEASKVFNFSPTGLYIFAYFKSCHLRVWLPISLKLDTKWNPSPCNTDKSWHTFNNGDLLRINQAA